MEFVYASPGRRLLGFVIDFFLLGTVSSLLLPLFDVTLEDIAEGTLPRAWEWTYIALTGLYQVGFVAWRGQTPGKMAVRTKVVSEAGGQVPGFGTAGARWLIVGAATALPVIGVLVLAAVYGSLMFDSRRQGIHDKVARTVVVDLFLPTAAPAGENGASGDL